VENTIDLVCAEVFFLTDCAEVIDMRFIPIMFVQIVELVAANKLDAPDKRQGNSVSMSNVKK
jgi:hypothetical protein